MSAVAVMNLSAEEDGVAAIDATGLIRMTVEAAKLGPCLMELRAQTKEFTNMLQKNFLQPCKLLPRLMYEKCTYQFAIPINDKIGSHRTTMKHTICQILIIDVITVPTKPVPSRHLLWQLQCPHLINRFP